MISAIKQINLAINDDLLAISAVVTAMNQRHGDCTTAYPSIV